MRRRKDGELAGWWMLLCRGCRLSTTKVNKSEQLEGLCARSSVVREIQWICRLPESTLVSRTGVRTERLIKKKKRKNRILYFKHSAVHLLSLFFFLPPTIFIKCRDFVHRTPSSLNQAAHLEGRQTSSLSNLQVQSNKL